MNRPINKAQHRDERQFGEPSDAEIDSDESLPDYEPFLDDRPRRSWLGLLWRISLGLVLLCCLTVGILYYCACQTPDFYQRALVIPEAEAFEEGESFEIAVLYMRNDMVEEDSWIAEFSEDQINGWLASDLQRKFPNALPEGFNNPRVSIDESSLKIAIGTKLDQLDTVIVTEVDIFPTEADNQFGVKVLGVHAGWAPIPVSLFTRPAAEYLRKSNIRVSWADGEDGNPIAYLTIPPRKMVYEGQQLVVEQIEIAADSIRMAGTSKSIDNGL